MPRPMLSLALLALALAPAACRSGPEPDHNFIHRSVRGYQVIDSAHAGKVGYVKTFDVEEGGGPTYAWRYVYDRDWNELGFIDQFGSAYAYHRYSPAEQAQQNETLRAMRLPSDSIEWNVMRMLGVDPATDSVTLHNASHADIAGDAGKTPLAGPGIVAAKSGEVAPAPKK